MLEFPNSAQIQRFDFILSVLNDANTNNDSSFRLACKNFFQKEFSTYEFHNNLELGMKMMGVGIFSAIKKRQGQYKKGTFTRKLSQIKRKEGLNINEVFVFLENANFSKVRSLLELQCCAGLKKTILSIEN